MPTWSKRAVVALAVLSLCVALVPARGPWRDLLQTFVQAACVGLAVHHVRRRPSVLRLGWGRLVLAVALLGLGDLISAVEGRLLDLHPLVAPSTVVMVTGYVLLGLAVVQLDRNRARGARLPGRIEAAIFASGVLTPVLVFLILPILGRGAALGPTLVSIAYVLADLVVITVIARLVLTDGAQSRAFAYLSLALFVSLAGDIASWVGSGAGASVEAGAVVKILWLCGFVLFAAGIAHPSMETFTSGGAWPHDAPRARRIWLMGLGQAMPALTLGFAVVFDYPLSASAMVIAVGGLVVTMLVVARMNGLLDQISEQSGRLSGLARSDELTGLHNRRSWNFELARACDQATAAQQPLGVALLDLDHFKNYNDSYGHPAGDRLLRAAADAWVAALQPGEVLARYGGEEFAMLVPGADLDRAWERVDSLRSVTPGGQTFSAGVTVWRSGQDPEQSVADADTALYQAKRAGRDQVVPYRAPTRSQRPDVPHAMSTVVQPIVRVRDLSVVSYEVLSRFDPATDVELVFAQAHEAGYGDLLESSAILSGLRLPDRPEGIELFVNVSERALTSQHFWRMMPPRLDGVVMELHERRHGLDDATLAGLLDSFRERGARICLDDLVDNHEDLDRIVSLRPDLVKVDRSLVTGCDTDPVRVERVSRLMAFAHRHGVTVCAEGVETVEELLTLRGLGVPLVQGYLLGHPQAQWSEPLAPALRIGRLPDLEPGGSRPASSARQ